jgi:hypothetical protein
VQLLELASRRFVVTAQHGAQRQDDAQGALRRRIAFLGGQRGEGVVLWLDLGRKARARVFTLGALGQKVERVRRQCVAQPTAAGRGCQTA